MPTDGERRSTDPVQARLEAVTPLALAICNALQEQVQRLGFPPGAVERVEFFVDGRTGRAFLTGTVDVGQLAADDFRQLRSSFRILYQLMARDSYRGWQTINTDPPKIQAVTAEDIRRVARTYFKPEKKNVLIFHTKE